MQIWCGHLPVQQQGFNLQITIFLFRDFRLILNPRKGLLHSQFKAYAIDGKGNEKIIHVGELRHLFLLFRSIYLLTLHDFIIFVIYRYPNSFSRALSNYIKTKK